MAAAFSRHLAAAADHLAAAARDLAGAAQAASRRRDREDEIDDIELPDLPSPSPDPYNTDEDMVAVLEHAYELFGVLLGVGIPVPSYFAVPDETKAGAAWVWSVFTYAVAFTISVRVFRSRCCLSTALRSLVLVFCLVAEVFAAFHFLPTARSVAAGACFSILHLVAIYLGVWAWRRRR